MTPLNQRFVVTPCCLDKLSTHLMNKILHDLIVGYNLLILSLVYPSRQANQTSNFIIYDISTP